MSDSIKTYPMMNREIKNILGFSTDSADEYVVVRLKELEEGIQSALNVASYDMPNLDKLKEIKRVLGNALNLEEDD